MHHAPTQSERAFLDDADPTERLEYFLTHALEAEEVWSLRNGLDWAMQEKTGMTILPVWPYAELASAHNQDSYTPDAVSLEHFIYTLLPQMIEQKIHIEVLPTPTHPGAILAPDTLFEIIERKMDSGEYFLEG